MVPLLRTSNLLLDQTLSFWLETSQIFFLEIYQKTEFGDGWGSNYPKNKYWNLKASQGNGTGSTESLFNQLHQRARIKKIATGSGDFWSLCLSKRTYHALKKADKFTWWVVLTQVPTLSILLISKGNQHLWTRLFQKSPLRIRGPPQFPMFRAQPWISFLCQWGKINIFTILLGSTMSSRSSIISLHENLNWLLQSKLPN